MADLLLDVQSPPTTPASGKSAIYVDSVTKRLTVRDDAGKTLTAPPSTNANTADVVASAADTYLAGSSIPLSPRILQVGAIFRWRFVMTKSAAGTAAPVWVVRVGVNGTTGDTARLTFTQVALQTAVVDTGFVEIIAVVRSVGAAGVMAGGLKLAHVLAATGFSTLDHNVLAVVSGGFDTTPTNLIVGVSVNPGAAGVFTHQVITVEAQGL